MTTDVCSAKVKIPLKVRPFRALLRYFGAFLVTLADEREDEVRNKRIQRDVTHFIDDEEVWVRKHPQFLWVDSREVSKRPTWRTGRE